MIIHSLLGYDGVPQHERVRLCVLYCVLSSSVAGPRSHGGKHSIRERSLIEKKTNDDSKMTHHLENTRICYKSNIQQSYEQIWKQKSIKVNSELMIESKNATTH